MPADMHRERRVGRVMNGDSARGPLDFAHTFSPQPASLVDPDDIQSSERTGRSYHSVVEPGHIRAQEQAVLNPGQKTAV